MNAIADYHCPDDCEDTMVDPLDTRTHRLLQAILEISNLVGSVMYIDDILDRIVETTAELMQTPVCSIYLLDPKTNRLVLRSNFGFEAELRGNASFGIGESIVGKVAESGEMISLDDATTFPDYRPLKSTIELGCKAYLSSPLRIQEDVIGVMTVRKMEKHIFSHEEVMFFETVAKQVAIVVEKSRMYDEKIRAERLAAVAVSLSGVAHYIKNLLTSVAGAEYIIDENIDNISNPHDHLVGSWKILKRTNRKIRDLVYNMLNYSRQAEPLREPVGIEEMITEIIESVRETAAQRNVQIEAELPSAETMETGEIMLEKSSMYDALLNLVTNGIDAIPDGREGKLEVRAERLDGQHVLRLEVADNGSGIPSEHHGEIFNLFFTTKGQKGTGIGLAATRKVIEDHGGTIEFESEIDQGTRFIIHLPMITSENTEEELQASAN